MAAAYSTLSACCTDRGVASLVVGAAGERPRRNGPRCWIASRPPAATAQRAAKPASCHVQSSRLETEKNPTRGARGAAAALPLVPHSSAPRPAYRESENINPPTPSSAASSRGRL